MSKDKNRRRRVSITPTLMSALTGDSEPPLPGDVPISIEVPIESLPSTSSCGHGRSGVDGKSKSSSSRRRRLSTASHEEEKTTVSSRPLVEDVMKENQRNYNSKSVLLDEGSKSSSKRVSISSSVKQSTTTKSKQSTTKKQTSTATRSKGSSRHDEKSDSRSRTSTRESTSETESSKKCNRRKQGKASTISSRSWKEEAVQQPKERSRNDNRDSTLREHQCLPTTMLADSQTDLIPNDQTTESKNNKNRKEKKKDIGPFQPEFDELPRLLLSDMQTDDPTTVKAALEKLGTLLKEKENLQVAYGLGAHVSLSMVMRKFAQETEIQRWGCFCFSSLARTKPIPALIIVRSGGIEALANAMQLLPDSLSVQTNVLLALYNLLTDLEGEAPDECDKTSDRFVNDLGGLQLVVQAMRRFPDEPSLQSVCCELCTNLVAKCKKRAMKTAGLAKARPPPPPPLPPPPPGQDECSLRSHQPVRPSILLPDHEKRALAIPKQLVPENDSTTSQQPHQDENSIPTERRGSRKYFGGKKKIFGRSTRAIANI